MSCLTRSTCVKLFACLTLAMIGTRSEGQTNLEEQRDFFEKSVRPLLVARCLECHSSDTETNGGLSLDSKSGWLTGGDSGPAINLSDWQQSLLWLAIDYRNPKLQMPPDTKLTDREKEIFRTWLGQGAFDPRESPEVRTTKKNHALAVVDAQQHWAYRVPVPSQIPISNAPVRNAIDAFLSKGQVGAGIECNERASQSILKQRLFVDLHGMRPSVDPLESNRPEHTNFDELGYQETVDALLASPRFGERFARHWMDAVRFAESITLRGFVLPDAWRYRNYLIDSFNRDKAVSEFIREQIAGDLMQAESIEMRQSQLVATTALALGDTNLEEQDKKQLEMDYVDEQLEMIGKVFLAQTIGCARCHDHKFDPIPTTDYYALAGILKSSVAIEHSNVSKWISVPLPLDSGTESKYKKTVSRHTVAKKRLDELKKKIQSSSESSLIVRVEDLEGVVVDDAIAKKIGNWEVSSSVKAYVGDGYLHDKNQGKGEKSVTFEPSELKPGSYRVRLSYTHGPGRANAAMVRIFSADGEDVVRVNQVEKPTEDGLWLTLGTYRFEQGGQAFVIVSNEESNGHVVADAVQFLPELQNPAAALVQVKQPHQVTPGPDIGQITKESMDSLRKEAASIEAELKSLQSELDSRPMVISLRASEKPSDLAIHIRGSVHQQGAIVPRGFLKCIPAMADTVRVESTSNGRLELANWLASDKNPLTARVYVNRVWGWLMGDGIVRTIDNFGTTGEPPSNLELLDWLTLEFIAKGWSTKWLVREIVLSDAYQRSSIRSKVALEMDPDNRLFARSGIRRLDAETMRDTLLALSGELDLAGQVESTIPSKLKEDYAFKHPVRYRSVYGPWFRNSMPDLVAEFDGANPSFPISKRNRSTIAPQALALLNSEWIAARSKRFGTRLVKMTGLSDEQKWSTCFLSTLSRLPSDRERQWAERCIRQARESQLAEEELWSSLVHNLVASIDFRYVE